MPNTFILWWVHKPELKKTTTWKQCEKFTWHCHGPLNTVIIHSGLACTHNMGLSCFDTDGIVKKEPFSVNTESYHTIIGDPLLLNLSFLLLGAYCLKKIKAFTLS